MRPGPRAPRRAKPAGACVRARDPRRCSRDASPIPMCREEAVRSRERKVAASRVPVPATAMVPSVVVKPSCAMIRRERGASGRRAAICTMRANGAPIAARTAHSGSKGWRSARMPAARAARRTGRSTAENMCACLCVSMCVRRTPAPLQKSDLRGGFGLDFVRADAACEKAQQECRERIRRNCPVRASTRLGIFFGGRTGSPSTRTTWQPTPSDGRCARQFNGLVCRAGARHQGGAGDQARGMQLGDGPVHARGQSKIVGVDDEAAHSVSLSTRAGSDFRMVNTLLS